MKKVLLIMITLFISLSCARVKPIEDEPISQPKEEFTLTIDKQGELEEIVLDEGEDYEVVLSHYGSYNRIYVDGKELDPDINNKYIIRNINCDKIITFNKQYQLTLIRGLGYELQILNHSPLVNQGESLVLQLILNPNYSDSNPLVEVNEEEIDVSGENFSDQEY